MRIYSPAGEETLRTRKFLKDWAGEGFLTTAQHQRLEQETVSDLRTTNIFLRLVLFLFTLIGVGAAVGLFFEGFFPHASTQTAGVFFLIFAALCYAAAEAAVSQLRLYRHGIEEALLACAVAFLCFGLQAAFFNDSPYLLKQSLMSAAGIVFSLWLWPRFGLWYAVLIAMLFAIFLPGYWTTSPAALHMLVAAVYATGLVCVVALRSPHRFDFLDDEYSRVEAFLWLGIYLAINLKVSSLNLPADLWGGATRASSEFARPFYWTTWVLIWCLPPVVLVRGIRRKDRAVIAVGAITAVLTLICNKPYLGWQRHTWDPMLLGILLTGIAVFTRRWLARAPSGIRHGFTAARLSGQDKHWMSVGSTVLGVVTPQSVTPAPQPTSTDFRFGGGSSGGGGASGDF